MRFLRRFVRFVGEDGPALGGDSVPAGLPALMNDNQISAHASTSRRLRRLAVTYSGPAGAPDLDATVYLFERLTGRWYRAGAATLTRDVAAFIPVLTIAPLLDGTNVGGALDAALVVDATGAEPEGAYSFGVTLCL